MNFEQYLEHFEQIVKGAIKAPPYDEAEMLHYTQMNLTRIKRWLKTGVVSELAKASIAAISQPQNWQLITEPWCGDAAHSVPFIYLLSTLNENISLIIQLRDSGSEIDQYLTNGGKAIPILIVRDAAGKDLLVWGPRPAAAQQLFVAEKEKGTPYEDLKIILQHWYNDNKGQNLQQEIALLLRP